MLLTEEQYQSVLKRIDGKALPNPLLEELQAWAQAVFGERIYDYICDTTNDGRLRLRIVFWDRQATAFFYEGWSLKREVQTQFRNQFAVFAGKYQKHFQYQNADHVFVCCDTISDQIQSKLLTELKTNIQAMKSGDITRIEIIFGSVHVLLYEVALRERRE